MDAGKLIDAAIAGETVDAEAAALVEDIWLFDIINDVSFIEQFPNLRRLVLSARHLDLSPLLGARHLADLCINARDERVDRTTLAGLTQLKELTLNIDVVGGWITNLVGLKSLNISTSSYHDTPFDCSHLAGMCQLEYLFLRCSHISNWEALLSLRQLKTLRVSCNRITALPELNAGSQNIEALDLQGCHDFRDASFLANWSALQSLYLSDTRVSDLGPLRGLEGLRELSFDHTPVKDVSPLVGLETLENVSLNNTKVADLSSLAHLQHTARFNFENTPAARRDSPFLPPAATADLPRFAPTEFAMDYDYVAVGCAGTSYNDLGATLSGLLNAFIHYEERRGNVDKLSLFFVPESLVSVADDDGWAEAKAGHIEIWSEVAKHPALFPLVDALFTQYEEALLVAEIWEDDDTIFPRTACFTLAMHHARYLGWYARFCDSWSLWIDLGSYYECEQGHEVSQMIQKHGWCEETMNMICVRFGAGGLHGFGYMDEFSALIIKHCPAPLDEHPFFIRLVETMINGNEHSGLDTVKKYMPNEIIAATNKVLARKQYDLSELQQWP